MNQEMALRAMKSGSNIFLTGPAGSGKTFVLNKYIDYLKKKKISVAVTASTGIAATHLDGTTIHSWSGIGINEQLTEKDMIRLSRSERFRRRMDNAKVIVIDEISMLHAHQLDMIEHICRYFKEPALPFGGLQVILCGDFFQLPPVRKNGSGNSFFVFESKAWIGMDIKVCYLHEQHRQNDDRILDVLNSIRANAVTDTTINILHSRIGACLAKGIVPTRLYTHNADVDRINENELEKIKSKTMRYNMQEKGKKKIVESLKAGCLAPENLRIKQGAEVMFVKNNFEAGYVNGTRGIIEDFDEDSKMPIVRTYSGKSIMVQPEEWTVEENDKVVASIRQIPLRLAWAITVHKSQGMSLDAAEIDLGKSFEFGMGYVALSRVRTLAGMRLVGINETALMVNPKIIEFDQSLMNISKEIEKEISQLPMVEEIEKADDVICIVSDNKAVEHKKSYDLETIRKKYPNAYMPWTDEDDKKLRENFKQGMSVRELAVAFQRQNGSISSRLKKLGIIIN